MKELISKLDKDKIKINFNQNPIKMDLFLSFITIETEMSIHQLNNGWTRRVCGYSDLIITGGFVNRIHYLDSLQYGIKLDNPYNNYVNPFYLFPIMNKEGRKFFFEYYKTDIEELIMRQNKQVQHEKSKLAELQNEFDNILEQTL